MALFFDSPWFDGKLAERGLDRGALAACAGLSREELHQIIVNEREASAAELAAFAELLSIDIVEITLRSGVSVRKPSGAEDSAARLDDLDARLDSIDRWIEELNARQRPEADYSSPSLPRSAKRA